MKPCNGVKGFVYWYNNEHRHSRIKFVTPSQRHDGRDVICMIFNIFLLRKVDLGDNEKSGDKSRIDFLGSQMTEISAQDLILYAMGLLLDSLRVTRPASWQGEII